MKLPYELVEALASDVSPETRKHVALNTNTPNIILDRLADDPSPHVWVGVADNYTASPATLQRLYQHGLALSRKGNTEEVYQVEKLFRRLVENRNLPVECLHSMLKNTDDEQLRQRASNALSRRSKNLDRT